MALSYTTEVDIANHALSILGAYKITDFAQAGVSYSPKCGELYPMVRDRLLRDHKWNFARASAVLSPTWVAITSITNNGGLIQVNKVAHGLVTGQRVNMDQTSNDGLYTLTRISADAFTLDSSVYTDATVGRYSLAPIFGWSYIFALPADCLMVRTGNGWENSQRSKTPFQIQGHDIIANCSVIDLVYTKQVTDVSLFDVSFEACLAMQLAIELVMSTINNMDRRNKLTAEYESITLPKAKRSNAIEPSARIIPQAFESPVVQARNGYYGYAYGSNVGAEPPLFS
jgi:hypothetical protein